MLASVSSAALADAQGAASGLDRIGAFCAIRYVSAEHRDPAAAVAARLAIRADATIHTAIGGDTPQAAIGELSTRIAAGELDSALVVGCEALSTLSRAMKAGEDRGWSDPSPESEPDENFGVDRAANSELETAAGLIAPLMIYPLFEHALWAREGGHSSELAERLGRLQARFSEVASTNPYSWTSEAIEAEFIAQPSAGNRQVTLPYTKLMNSNIQVDQAAAVFMCSHSKADELGIPLERRVYVHGASHATEPWFFSERDDLGRSPALSSAAQSALAQASVGIDDVALLDIYSCFPSAIRIAAAELGVDLFDSERSPTVTGGLSFAGGPGNAYVLQSVTEMVKRLRTQPEEKGLVTAVGWYLTKHGVGVYGSKPPSEDFRAMERFAEPPGARRVHGGNWSGKATAETATMLFERDGSRSFGILTAIAEDGSRILSNTTETDLLEWIDSGEPVTGKSIEVAGGTFTV
jgi:acetyl-CoA C-acetyltransferase